MIRVVCKACGSSLKAKEELVGQTRPCPKCRQPVVIRPAEESNAARPMPPAATSTPPTAPVNSTAPSAASPTAAAPQAVAADDDYDVVDEPGAMPASIEPSDGKPAPYALPLDDYGVSDDSTPYSAGSAAFDAAINSQDAASAEPQVEFESSSLPPVERPIEQLHRENLYWVFSDAGLLAIWEGLSQGWMVKTPAGMLTARRADAQLPNEGDFKLVEVIMESSADGPRLTGLRIFQLARRWALRALAKSDDAICAKVEGRSGLNQRQKMMIRDAIRERFMPEVWHDSPRVHEYLASYDAATPGTD